MKTNPNATQPAGTNTPAAATPIAPSAAAPFGSFNWCNLTPTAPQGAQATARLLDTVLDVATGAATALELAQESANARDEARAPTLSPFHLHALGRLATRALMMLHDYCEDERDRLEQAHGRASNGAGGQA